MSENISNKSLGFNRVEQATDTLSLLKKRLRELRIESIKKMFRPRNLALEIAVVGLLGCGTAQPYQEELVNAPHIQDQPRPEYVNLPPQLMEAFADYALSIPGDKISTDNWTASQDGTGTGLERFASMTVEAPCPTFVIAGVEQLDRTGTKWVLQYPSVMQSKVIVDPDNGQLKTVLVLEAHSDSGIGNPIVCTDLTKEQVKQFIRDHADQLNK